MLKAIEAREVSAEKFIRTFAKVVDDFADPAARIAAEKNRAEMERLKNSFAVFVREVHKSGFADIMMTIYGSLSNMLDAMTPVARFVTRTLKAAFTTLTFPMRVIVALAADMIELFGVKLNGTFATFTAKILGVVVGLAAMFKLGSLTLGAFLALKNIIPVLTGIRLALIGMLGPIGLIISGALLMYEVFNMVQGLDFYKDTVKNLQNKGVESPNPIDVGSELIQAPGVWLYRKFNEGSSTNVIVKPDGSKFSEAVAAEIQTNNQSVIQSIQANSAK